MNNQYAEVGKRYRHYKNRKEYTVIAIGRMESDHTQFCVVYRAEYENELGKNVIWVRNIQEFEEVLIIDGKEVHRYEVLP